MKKKVQIISMMTVFILFMAGIMYVFSKTNVLPAPNGITLPEGYKKWHLIASSYRTDNSTLRVILGNDKAIESVEMQKTNPWPDGSIMAKLVWKEAKHEKWPSAIIPGDFFAVEFMIKDSKKYSSTGGWGFARWLGLEMKPYGKNADFVKECFDCHLPVKDNDYVFTKPVILP